MANYCSSLDFVHTIILSTRFFLMADLNCIIRGYRLEKKVKGSRDIIGNDCHRVDFLCPYYIIDNLLTLKSLFQTTYN